MNSININEYIANSILKSLNNSTGITQLSYYPEPHELIRQNKTVALIKSDDELMQHLFRFCCRYFS